jgi:hypothetical protein
MTVGLCLTQKLHSQSAKARAERKLYTNNQKNGSTNPPPQQTPPPTNPPVKFPQVEESVISYLQNKDERKVMVDFAGAFGQAGGVQTF